MRAIGLMSGTSFDGVDVALIETDGEAVTAFGPAAGYPYSDAERAVLRGALADAADIASREERPGRVAEAEDIVTQAHLRAVERFLAGTGTARESIDVVGFHGQTVLHRPERRLTVQIGDGPELARALRLPVVHDLRAADVAAGGQGAPLVPVYHRALAGRLQANPVAFVNIGGVANVTYVGRDGGLIAFDTGPGNALIDDWVFRHTGLPCDEDGRIARAGRLPEGEAFMRYLQSPYFEKAPPKSLDRNDFPLSYVEGLPVGDGARVLTHVTVSSIARAAGYFPEPPAMWVICGGGRRNAFMMETLRGHLSQPMMLAEEAGFDGDAIEAQAFAYLAARSLKGLPISFPGTTGVPSPMTGGVLARP